MIASRWTLLPAAIVLVASLASLLLPATPEQRTSGDEPHYLITAISLAEDGDLDVSDEYADELYRPFHAPDLVPQGRRQADGSVVEPHDPLLPALLAVPVALGGWRGAKIAIALLAGAAAAVVASTLTRPLGLPVRTGVATVTVLLATAPFAVHGAQVYPEVPAGLAIAVALVGLLARPSRWRDVAVVASVVVLPWLSVKHVPVAAVLAAALLARRWRDDRGRAGVIAAVLLAAALGYVLAHLAWYGGVTVYAAGRFFATRGGEIAVLGTDPDLLGRTTRLVGLLVDRHFGLAAWQPAWLLLVPAAAEAVRRRPPGWAVVVAVLVTGWLNATYLAATMHGFWFPGRHLVAVLPAAAIVAGWWAAGSRTRLAVLGVAGALGAVSYGALLVGAATGETSAVFFAGAPDPWRTVWARVLPHYPRGAVVDWLLHGAWSALLGGLAVVGWRAARRGQRT